MLFKTFTLSDKNVYTVDHSHGVYIPFLYKVVGPYATENLRLTLDAIVLCIHVKMKNIEVKQKAKSVSGLVKNLIWFYGLSN